jgi:hypothetical protein
MMEGRQEENGGRTSQRLLGRFHDASIRRSWRIMLASRPLPVKQTNV